MAWTKADDSKIKEYIDTLTKEEIKLQSQLNVIGTLLNNSKSIQTREVISYGVTRIQRITRIKPKDKWGDDMTDQYRLDTKTQCIAKTKQLLGEPDDE